MRLGSECFDFIDVRAEWTVLARLRQRPFEDADRLLESRHDRVWIGLQRLDRYFHGKAGMELISVPGKKVDQMAEARGFMSILIKQEGIGVKLELVGGNELTGVRVG